MRLSAVFLCGAALACHSPLEKSYRVLGGTITGLKGTGLVLKNGNETLPIAATDGSFKFTTRVRESEAYAVSVASSPLHPSQDCTVTAGGSGTMPDANVLTVQVGCVTKKYSVGGTVTGLKGTLILNASDTNTVTVTADGAFVLPESFTDGTAYTVTIKEQPELQECTFTSETGTVDGANVTSVAVACVDLYTVSGTLKGAASPVELALNGVTQVVPDNGQFTFPAKLKTGEEYGVTVSMLPAHQKCVLTHESGAIADHSITDIVVTCARWYEFGTLPAATFVLGQADLVSTDANRGGGLAANTLNGPRGNMVVAGGHLWVSDSTNNRVLGFGEPTTNGQDAVVVLGQSDFITATPDLTKSAVNGPATIATDGTRLFVADAGNGRVLIYDTIPAASTVQPDHVVGQKDFVTSDHTCDRGTFGGSASVFVSGGKLFVADSDHNRVLIWNAIPTTDGALPDLVLGQNGFESCTANDANGDTMADATPSASTMSLPTSLWTDGEKLVVVDAGNNRVLVWNTLPTQSGQVADLVIGQSEMLASASSVTVDHLNDPRFVASTGQQLFVADSTNNRIVIWNSLPTQNGKAADAVIGQPDFVSAVANNDGTGTSVASAKGLHSPSGLLLQDGRLWVLDADNNRLVAFDSTY